MGTHLKIAPSTMLRMVPLPRFAGEDKAASQILPRLRGVRRTGETRGSPRQRTAEGGRGGKNFRGHTT